MKCNVKVNIHQDVLDNLVNTSGRAVELTVEAIRTDIVTRQVVPKDIGELERSGFVSKVSDVVYAIIYDTPYARRWYFNADGATFQKTKNPNAKDHWMDYYLEGEGKNWVIDTYAKFLKQESGGIIK